MTSREKFEAWYLENWGCTEDNHDSLFEESPHGGEYYRFGVRLAWDSWQAASKASEQQLEESRREFLAADATIHNLELQLTDMAVQLANAESKCRELAAENAALKQSELDFDEMAKSDYGPDWVSELTKTPATDAFLAEVLASELDSLAGVAETMLVKFSNQRCSQDMHEVVGWKMVLQQASNRAAKLRKGAVL